MDDVGEDPCVAELLATAQGLGAALVGEGDVDPAGEEVLGVPLALAVAEEDQRVGRVSSSEALGDEVPRAWRWRPARSDEGGLVETGPLARVGHDRDVDRRGTRPSSKARVRRDVAARLEGAGDRDAALGREADQAVGRDEIGKDWMSTWPTAVPSPFMDVEADRLGLVVVHERRDEGAGVVVLADHDAR